jgi:translation initiation factor IF-2
MGEAEGASLNLLLKTDVQGSSEALVESLSKLSTDEVNINIISTAVGGITETDVNLAMASTGIIIGFNVRADNSAKKLASEEGVDIRYYSIIYDVIDDVKKAISGLLAPEIREEIIGIAEVKEVFRSKKLGDIAGCIVLSGVVRKNSPIRVLRDNVVVYEGELESLRRFKDDVKEVKSGTECGIGVKNYNGVVAGDQIEIFERISVVRTV